DVSPLRMLRGRGEFIRLAKSFPTTVGMRLTWRGGKLWCPSQRSCGLSVMCQANEFAPTSVRPTRAVAEESRQHRAALACLADVRFARFRQGRIYSPGSAASDDCGDATDW